MTRTMGVDASTLLRHGRNPDGGFGARVGQTSEAEPTALAAIALDDDDARAWLADHRSEDGSFSIEVGPYVNDSVTALAALALAPGPDQARALDHVEAGQGPGSRSAPAAPADPHPPRGGGGEH